MEKERLDKLRHYWELNVQLDFFERRNFEKGSQWYEDLIECYKIIGLEVISLHHDLYPKDLMEDVKERQEKMKAAKSSYTGNRIPPLTLRQKIGLFFRKG